MKSIQFTNETINKNIIQTTVWFCRQAGEKEPGNIISHHKVKNYDFKTSKKRNKEILLRER